MVSRQDTDSHARRCEDKEQPLTVSPVSMALTIYSGIFFLPLVRAATCTAQEKGKVKSRLRRPLCGRYAGCSGYCR